MKFFPFAVIILFIILLPIYIHAEKHGGFKKATTIKLILSGLCSVCALLGFALGGTNFDCLNILVVLALVCALFGDYFLQFIRLDAKKFNIGIICFALTQIFLIIYLIARHGISWQEFVMTAVIAVGVLILMVKQKWQLGSAQAPLSVYTVLLAFMTSKAILALFSSNGITLSVILMAAGAALFLLSDLLLGIWNYNTGKRIHANMNWITYFCAILLIALSISPLPGL